MQQVIFGHFERSGGVRYGVSDRSHGSMRPESDGFVSNRNRFFSDCKLPEKRFWQVKQVHGKTVVSVSSLQEAIPEADGMITKKTNLTMGIVTADCVPIFIYDPKNRLAGVVHAGWKGIVQGIVAEAVVRTHQAGSKPQNLLIGIGPSIGNCCYNVDAVRVEEFKRALGGSVVAKGIQRKGTSWYLSLQSVITNELRQLGIKRENIEDCAICTACESEKYFSFRKAADRTMFGEFLSAISLV